MRTLRVAAGLLLAVLSLSSGAWAQASITGVVKDSSGAVLPGVTVETSSPALIEKVRTAVTDESGRYRIVDLSGPVARCHGGNIITVNLIEPGTLYGDRVNQFDLRFAKILRFGRTRTNVGFDVYNVMTAAPVLTYNQAFVPNGAWLTPTSVLQPRFVKFSAQIDF